MFLLDAKCYIDILPTFQLFELSQQLEALAESIPLSDTVNKEDATVAQNGEEGDVSTIADLEYERLTSPEDAFEDAFGELDEAVLHLAPRRNFRVIFFTF